MVEYAIESPFIIFTCFDHEKLTAVDCAVVSHSHARARGLKDFPPVSSSSSSSPLFPFSLAFFQLPPVFSATPTSSSSRKDLNDLFCSSVFFLYDFIYRVFFCFSFCFRCSFCFLFFVLFFLAPVEFKTLLIGCCSTIIILLLLVLSISSLLRFFIVSLYSIWRFLLLHSCLFCYVCFTLEVGECIVFSDQFELSLCGCLGLRRNSRFLIVDRSVSVSLCFSFNSLKNDKPLWLHDGELLLFANLQEAHYCFHCNRLVPRMIELILLSQIFVFMITVRTRGI